MNKKIIALISIPIFGFMVFLVVHFSFLKTLQVAEHKIENLRVKQIISSDINYEIIKIKSLFYQTVLLSTNKRGINYNIKLLKEELQKTKKMLFILRDGGVYKKVVSLNIVGKNSFEEEYKFVKDKKSLEVINLLPKIYFLEKKAQELQKILSQMYIGIKIKDISKIKKRRKKIVRFARSLDSVFRRMIEDSNRLFYKSQMEFLNLQKEIKFKHQYYQQVEFGLIIFLIFMFIVIGYIIIKELTSLNESLEDKLYIDDLTKAYTRKKLEDMQLAQNSVLYLIDIDKFSEINELYGMEIGNKILQIIAQKLQTDNPEATLFRLSADVFGLYIDDSSKMNMSIEDKIAYIRKHLMFKSIVIDDYNIDFNVTISVAFGKNALHNAFAALNIAKNDNLQYAIFTTEEKFKKQIEFNKTWQKEIKYAIEESRIEPFFQPIVNKDKKIVKYESLMRMKKTEGENIKYIPPFFIDVAIKTKQYLTISKQMIEKTFIYFKDGGEFSINLSYIDMNNESMKELIEYLIVTYNAQDRVTFEILENEGIQDYQVIEKFINHFRKYNVKIAIDDFGSGYSNFKRIMAINPDYIKFDGSLIKNIDTDSYSYLIVKNLVNFAKEANIKTVAEFIYSKEVFDTCVYLGIDLFQGYYFSEPKKEIVKD